MERKQEKGGTRQQGGTIQIRPSQGASPITRVAVDEEKEDNREEGGEQGEGSIYHSSLHDQAIP